MSLTICYEQLVRNIKPLLKLGSSSLVVSGEKKYIKKLFKITLIIYMCFEDVNSWVVMLFYAGSLPERNICYSNCTLKKMCWFVSATGFQLCIKFFLPPWAWRYLRLSLNWIQCFQKLHLFFLIPLLMYLYLMYASVGLTRK